MTISAGQTLPEATLIRMGANGAEQVSISALTKGRKVVIFGVPGAFTPTCHSAHVPSFIRTKDGFAAKGVDEIICVSVNDPFVMKAWGEATGANAAGLSLLADADSSFTKALGGRPSRPIQTLRALCRGWRGQGAASRRKPRHLRNLGRRVPAQGNLTQTGWVQPHPTPA